MNNHKHIKEKIRALAPWFHNVHISEDLQTEPNHFLGDFPAFKWERLKDHLPEDLQGWSVLDIGCNAGYYSFELAKRGASVLGIDLDTHYLAQAKWLAETLGLSQRTSFRQLQVYDLAQLERKFDLVVFMGLFYHLRYPMLAMDIVSEKVGRKLIFQTLMVPRGGNKEWKDDYAIDDRQPLMHEGWPKLAFIEKKFAGDPTNWWVPNQSAVLAMARSCGLSLIAEPLDETYIFEPDMEHIPDLYKWDYSELLSARGKDWQAFVAEKIRKK